MPWLEKKGNYITVPCLLANLTLCDVRVIREDVSNRWVNKADRVESKIKDVQVHTYKSS